MIGGSFQGRFDDIQKIKNSVFLAISGFLLTGGFLSSRGLTTEAVLVDIDSKMINAASKLKDAGLKK